MKMCSFFSLIWVLCLFVLGCSAASAAAHAEGGVGGKKPGGGKPGPRRFRAPNEEEKAKLSFLASFFTAMFLIFTEDVKCSGDVTKAIANAFLPNGFEEWQDAGAGSAIMIILGAIPVVLFDLIKSIKASRNVYRFLADCKAEGSLCAIYEQTSNWSEWWVVHDMKRNGHDLLRLTKRAVEGHYYKPVYIAVNIPPEKVLQKLAQYNLVIKNGYKRLPPPKTSRFPKGGSIVHFYYQAEYARIWG